MASSKIERNRSMKKLEGSGWHSMFKIITTLHDYCQDCLIRRQRLVKTAWGDGPEGQVYQRLFVVGVALLLHCVKWVLITCYTEEGNR